MSIQREHWGSRLGFVLATAGSAVGLGSLWRFPYLAGANGGGAFVFFFLIFTLIFGVPLFIAEAMIGRSSQKAPVLAFFEISKHSHNWRLVGWLGVFSCFTILSFYSVVAGWSLNYVLMSLNQFVTELSIEEVSHTFDLLYQSGGINLFWHFIFMTMTVFVVWGGVRKGIEHWARILMPLLFVILLVLFFYVSTLPGFSTAFKFIFYPDFTGFTFNSLLESLGMALFTMSLGLGIILTYGSYMKSSENLPKISIIIQIVNVSVTLLASMIIFPIVFTFGGHPEEGPGLVFKTLPVMFTSLKGAILISTVFFSLMVFTALTSTISLLEVLVANFSELYHWSRKKSALICGFAAFTFGIPSALSGSGYLFPSWKKLYGLDFLETVSALTNWQLPIGGLCMALFIGWRVDKALVLKEFQQGSTKKTKLFFHIWFFSIRWLVPLGIVIILLQKGELLPLEQFWLYFKN
jgi:neurotransmitter:Na+ symporter, NSS family